MERTTTYVSSDMGIVAWLRYSGYETQEVAWVDGNCRWTFYATTRLLEKVDEYLNETGSVEPRHYNALFAQAKRELHSAQNLA